MSIQGSETPRLWDGYGLASVPVWPNALVINYYCIRPDGTCYGARVWPTPPLAFYCSFCV